MSATVVLKIPDGVEVSDGYHTFGELYEHRIALWMAICKLLAIDAWRSRKHSDGSCIDGWFVLGLFDDAGKQMTYHLPNSRWDECDFAETLDRAPKFDGHTSADVLKRLARL
jgi:hypothetical protein